MHQHNSLLSTKAHESRVAIERLYIEMRHVFNSGYYKPSGLSGKVIDESLLTLSPEIYGSIADSDKVELEGLVYVIDRLPRGIEKCRFIKITSDEGYEKSAFEAITPAKRLRACYMIDEETMLIEVTRGRSEIYDIVTHLTFLYNEAEKIKQHAFDKEGHKTREWEKLEYIILNGEQMDEHQQQIAFSYLSSILGRTFVETQKTFERLAENSEYNSGLFEIVFWLGRMAMEEEMLHKDREISFSPVLRERIGRHIYGERWAWHIKKMLHEYGLLQRPLHIISANLHSVLNAVFAYPALRESLQDADGVIDIALELNKQEDPNFQNKIVRYAKQSGTFWLSETYGTNTGVQIFDTAQWRWEELAPELHFNLEYVKQAKPVIIVMDYAFGEQAYETMDELLKPFRYQQKQTPLQVVSISIMGKAGILKGEKGDIMIPTSHVFEGTADNYPFENEFTSDDFEGQGLQVYEGPMITVLGTSLQNKDVLAYFRDSSWNAIGLEMEGAHYQKAIQAESKIRKSISSDVVIRYAYYASDNPLITGSTLASGSLGMVGVKPTYLITLKILDKILNPKLAKGVAQKQKTLT